jgi:hypothetical protein
MLKTILTGFALVFFHHFLVAREVSAIPDRYRQPSVAQAPDTLAPGTHFLNTSAFTLGIDEQGRIRSWKSSSGEYAVQADPGVLLQIVENDKPVRPVRAIFDKETITLRYPDGKTAKMQVINKQSYLTFKLIGISDGVDAVIWGPFNTVIKDTIGGAVGVVRSAGFAIGIQCLNNKTSGGELVNEEGAVFDRGSTATPKPFGSSLQAFSVDRSRDRKITVWGHWPDVPVKGIADGGLTGSSIALFGCRPGAVLSVIKTIIEQQGLPYAQWKNEWIKQSPAPGLPYLITTFSESNIDTFLGYAKRMGLAGVYHEDPFDSWGHFTLKKSLFPHGIAGFKACVDKAHAMGLRLGFHVLSNFITTNDAYVTPVPDPRLAGAGSDTLAGDVTADATEIPVESSFYFSMRSDLNSVMIGDEIVRYMDVTKTPPYRLTGCVRGAFGTRSAAHKAGGLVTRLMDHPYKVFFPNWQLQQEMAGNIARFIRETGADQMDFDGHEGTYATGMGDLSFATFAEEVFKQAGHPVIFGSSRSNHDFWRIDSYLNWGEPWYGGFRESQSDQRIANQKFYEENYLPNMLGWFLITAQTTPDDIDWMLARAAGFNAGYALVLRQNAFANVHMDEIIDRINIWTEVQRKGLFSPEQRAWLKDPANDVSLSAKGGKWTIQRSRKFVFEYEAKVLQPGQPTYSSWDFDNAESSQVPGIMLTASGAEGTVSNPVIEIDNAFRMAIPITLSAGQSLVIGDTSAASLYDEKGRFLRLVPLDRKLPELNTGKHTITLDAVMDANAPVKAKMVLKLLEDKETL